MNRSYIINDADGNPMNAKYPPNKELYGDEFSGYKNRTEEVLFSVRPYGASPVERENQDV